MKTLILSNNTCTADFTTRLSHPIYLHSNKEYEVALLSVNLYNSIPNTTEENNIFKYSIDNGSTWKIVSLDKESYELQAINDKI